MFIFLVLSTLFIGVLKKNIYDSKLGINILVITKEGIGIVGIRAGENLANFLVLPNNLVIETLRGEFLIEALWKVGLPEADSLKVTRVGVGRALGVPLGGVIKSNLGLSYYDLLSSLISFSSRTNLSLTDRIRLYSDLSNLLKKGMRLELNFPQNVTDIYEEPDGKRILRTNQAVYTWTKNHFASDEILSETAEVSVVNASGKDGIGRLLARQLETAGIRVIEVAGSSNKLSGICVMLSEKKVPKTALFIEKTFGCRKGGDHEKNYIERDVKADLVLIVGEEN
ncbi:LytR C-terminal domain-containing protein [Candidatus Woesebacteria bacterium]|nr:LytR C-terminal domain-containing protein [Candidatus Woesebacteria bacterium]